MYMNRLTALLRIGGLALLLSASILAHPAPTQGDQGHTILFVCEHGSAKSIIAAAHFNDLANKNGCPIERSLAAFIQTKKYRFT